MGRWIVVSLAPVGGRGNQTVFIVYHQRPHRDFPKLTGGGGKLQGLGHPAAVIEIDGIV